MVFLLWFNGKLKLFNLVFSLVSKMLNSMNLHNLAISLVLFGNSFITRSFLSAKRTRLWCNIADTTTGKVISDFFWTQSYSLSFPAEFYVKEMYNWFLSSFLFVFRKKLLQTLSDSLEFFITSSAIIVFLGVFFWWLLWPCLVEEHKPCILGLNRKLLIEHLRILELQIVQVK